MNRNTSPWPAWWNQPGPDECEFCHRPFHVEVGYYCADCDRPVCPVCVVTVRDCIACPECCTQGEDR